MKITHQNKSLLTTEVLDALIENECKAVRDMAALLDTKTLSKLRTATMSATLLRDTIRTALANPVEFSANFPDQFFGASAEQEPATDEETIEVPGQKELPLTKAPSTPVSDSEVSKQLESLHKEILVIAQKVLAVQGSVSELRSDVIKQSMAVRDALKVLGGGIAACIAASDGNVPDNAAEVFGELGAYVPFNLEMKPQESPGPKPAANDAPPPATSSGKRKGTMQPPK